MNFLRTQENAVFVLLKSSLEDTLNSHYLRCLKLFEMKLYLQVCNDSELQQLRNKSH